MDKYVVSTNEIRGTLTELIDSGGYVPVCVSGYSMRPLLRHNKDTVWIRKCPVSGLRRGRIVLYRRTDGRLFLHRIRKIKKDGSVLVNGDAQTFCEVIDVSQIIGAVYETERNGSRLPYDCLKLKCYEKIWYFTKPFRPVLLRVLHLFGVC